MTSSTNLAFQITVIFELRLLNINHLKECSSIAQIYASLHQKIISIKMLFICVFGNYFCLKYKIYVNPQDQKYLFVVPENELHKVKLTMIGLEYSLFDGKRNSFKGGIKELMI